MEDLDLWPEKLDLPGLNAPNIILSNQASLLGKKTKNLVEADVVRDDEYTLYQGKFNYQFRIVAPLLGGYKYVLFSVVHEVNFYPLEIIVDEDLAQELSEKGNRKIIIVSEEKFIEALQKIFAAKKTRQVITAIKLQSSDENPKIIFPNEEDIPF